jgi:thiol-disulfide isomerase/thioredoxin
MGNFQVVNISTDTSEFPFLVDGETERTLANYRGRGVVINFWATWCAPCVREMPALDRLSAELANDRIAVLALSADYAGAPIVRKFYDKNGINNLEVMVDLKGQVARSFKVPGLPTTIMLGADGREAGRVLGIAEWDAPETISFLRGCLGSTD